MEGFEYWRAAGSPLRRVGNKALWALGEPGGDRAPSGGSPCRWPRRMPPMGTQVSGQGLWHLQIFVGHFLGVSHCTACFTCTFSFQSLVKEVYNHQFIEEELRMRVIG